MSNVHHQEPDEDEDRDDLDDDADDRDYDEDEDEDEDRRDGDDAARAGDDGERPKRRRKRRRQKPAENWEPGDDDDGRALRALDFVSDVVDQMGMDCRVELRPPKDESANEINLDISGRDAGRIIGKKGQVLTALQFLTNRVINRPGLEKRPIVVDAEGYVSRRDNSLASMAKRLGKQAVNEGKIITFEPMNARDRRVVHLALAKFEGVITKSEGEGNDRRVQIIPVRR